MRKKLLSEAQVRRFQSLASIKPLNEMDSSYKSHDEEDKMEEAYGDEAHMKDDMMEEEDEAHMKDDMMEEEDEDMDADEDEEMGQADVELDEELVDQFMDAVKTIEQVADALSGAAGGEEEMDLGGEDLGAPGGDEPMALDAGDEEDEPEEDE